jgi:nucleoside-diphosphate-sugar epimerase
MTSSLYIVTGANGWLGRRVVRALTQGHAEMGEVGRGAKLVRIFLAPKEDGSDLAALGAQAMTGDVRDAASVRALMSGAEGATVIHLAGVIHPRTGTREFIDVNVDGTRNVVEAAAAAHVKRVIVMSSNSPIGVSRNPAEVFDEDSPYKPYMGYGRSKRAMEEWLRHRMSAPGMPEITIVRAPWFYGPEQPARQTRFFTMIKLGRFPLMDRGQNRRSMGYVDSLAYGILLTAAAPAAAGRIYWLADRRPYPMSEIVDTVRSVLHNDFGFAVRPKTVNAPGLIADLARGADWTLQAAGKYNQQIHVLSEMNLTIACSIERAKRELGYQPLVELREGMRRSVAWVLDHGGRI